MARRFIWTLILSATVAGLAVGAANFRSGRSNGQETASCVAASSWRTVAAGLEEVAGSGDGSPEDESQMFQVAVANKRLALVVVPDSEGEPAEALLATLTQANVAARTWVSEGFQFFSLVNSGLSNELQRKLAFEDYHQARLSWQDAVHIVSAETEHVCGTNPISVSRS